MKNILPFLVAFLIVLSFCGCADKSPNVVSSVSESNSPRMTEAAIRSNAEEMGGRPDETSVGRYKELSFRIPSTWKIQETDEYRLHYSPSGSSVNFISFPSDSAVALGDDEDARLIFLEAAVASRDKEMNEYKFRSQENGKFEEHKMVTKYYDLNLEGGKGKQESLLFSTNENMYVVNFSHPVPLDPKDAEELEAIRQSLSISTDNNPERNASTASAAIDWDSVSSDWKTEITDPKFFSYVKDAYADLDDNQIVLTAVVGDATDPQVALELADTMIRRFNAIATLQKSSIAPPSKDYYGGLYDQYGVMIGIAPFSQQDNTDKWFVYQFILPGMHTKQAPKLQKAYQ